MNVRPKIYIPDGIPGLPTSYLVQRLLSTSIHDESSLFNPVYPFVFDVDITVTSDEADFILVPHALGKLDFIAKQYLDALGEHKLPIVVVVKGDLSHRFSIPGCIMLKGTQYTHLKKQNEIIIAPISEDLGSLCGVTYRHKVDIPTVGFCGWATFKNLLEVCKYYIKILIHSRYVYRKGLFFRRQALRMLSKTDKIKTNFIIRNSFSSRKDTIALDPEVARQEFISNIQESDFILAVKGDANYSVRFFETLSLGRIPILIDTNVCLPFSEEIDYDSFIVRVPYYDIKNIDQYIDAFYSLLSEDEYIQKQKLARQAFERYLRYDSCFNLIFKKIANEKH